MSARGEAPLVSVLMPTYGQAAFVTRAIESLLAQTLRDWELVILDDGSPDDTADVVRPYLADPRVRYTRRERNGGLGDALNAAMGLARGRYMAYLPSDDLYYPEHLAGLAAILDARPRVYLAHGGLRYGYQRFGAAPDNTVSESVARPGEAPRAGGSPPLKLVQVMHRRDHERLIRWATRDEHESDALEADTLAALAGLGEAGYTGAISCEWLDHAGQRTKLIAHHSGGLSRYRAHYGLGRGVWVNWQPTQGPRLDERRRYGDLAVARDLPAAGGLRILLVGELGFNPERIVAFEERGHHLTALWVPRPESWDTGGPLPFGNVEVIPYDRRWRERVRAARPDVIYALLNWQAVGLIDEVAGAGLGVPIVFHFKEGPFICYEHGLWPALVRVLRASAAQLFVSAEAREWFHLALGGLLDRQRTHVLDGDLPRGAWLSDEWAPKLSEADGQIHTVLPGRPLGLAPFAPIASAGIHLHLYGEQFHQLAPNFVREGLATGHLHLHPAVEPADWVRELSRYDAAWLHLFSSGNGGDLRRANWDDLNLPARLGTYAAAGLPWIYRDNAGSAVAPQSIARDLDIGLPCASWEDLAAQLRDRERLARLTANMRANRRAFSFDAHVDWLIALFRRVIG